MKPRRDRRGRCMQKIGKTLYGALWGSMGYSRRMVLTASRSISSRMSETQTGLHWKASHRSHFLHQAAMYTDRW